jgi:thioredoxin 1
MIHTLTDENFQAEVLDAELPTLVDFTASWCGPCKQLAPIVKAIATDHSTKLRVGKLDIDENALVADQHNVRSVPTLLLFKNGKVIDSFVGAAPRSKLEAWLSKHI